MISVCILTKDAAATLAKTLESTLSFPEVLLLDNGSTDATLEIAGSYPNVKILQTSFKGFGALRNEVAAAASFNWILALDSDETITTALLEEILSLSLEDPHCVYLLPRHNFYNGKWIRGCGWHPEKVARLYHRKATRFRESQVHESLILNNLKQITLRSPLYHVPYRTTEEFLAKMQHYSTLFAQEQSSHKRSSFSKALLHGLFAFFRSYLLKKGLFLGKEGFLISLHNANTAFYKYLKLAEKRNISYGKEK